MAEREERMLNDYLLDSRIAEQRVSEFDLNAAVNRGIERGNKGRRRANYILKYGSAAGLLSLSLVLIMIFRIGYSGPAPAADIKFSAPDYVIAQIQENPSWLEAANHGLYQPLNQSTEKNGYKLRIDGVLADNAQAILFYTSENLTGTTPLVMEKYTVKSNNSAIGIGNLLGDHTYPVPDTGPMNHGIIGVNFSNFDNPGSFTLESQWSKGQGTATEQLKTTVQLDSSKFNTLVKTVAFNQFVSIGNSYGFTIKKVDSFPLSTVMSVNYESDNKRIQSFVSPSLSVKMEEGTESVKYLTSLTNNKGPYRIYFEGIFYEPFSQVTFAAKGIEEPLADTIELVIDTAQHKLIKAPDERLELNDIISSEQSTELKFALSIKGRGGTPDSAPFYVYPTFKDAVGGTHTLMEEDQMENSLRTLMSKQSLSQDQQSHSILIQPEKYAQPLTFQITSYPGTYYLQEFSVTK